MLSSFLSTFVLETHDDVIGVAHNDDLTSLDTPNYRRQNLTRHFPITGPSMSALR
jgi:hypothetical protein